METLKKQNKPKAQGHAAPTNGKVAIVLIRGMIGTKPEVYSTITLLKLLKKNTCVVYPKTKSLLGMLMMIKDMVTWGDLDDETYALLLQKKGKKKLEGEKENNVFHLNSPRKGFGRKGIKQPFSQGGGLGDRGVKINDLIKRMLL